MVEQGSYKKNPPSPLFSLSLCSPWSILAEQRSVCKQLSKLCKPRTSPVQHNCTSSTERDFCSYKTSFLRYETGLCKYTYALNEVKDLLQNHLENWSFWSNNINVCSYTAKRKQNHKKTKKSNKWKKCSSSWILILLFSGVLFYFKTSSFSGLGSWRSWGWA